MRTCVLTMSFVVTFAAACDNGRESKEPAEKVDKLKTRTVTLHIDGMT